jgi:TolB-like protein/cytochrome c-type biogenesis protein CcmH/NrfG
MQQFINELRRRNIIRVAGGYAAGSWLIIQLGIALEASLNLPSGFDTFVTTFVLAGFPLVIIITWAFEVTPDGIRRKSETLGADGFSAGKGRSSGIIIMVSLIFILMLIGWQTLGNSKADSDNNITAVELSADSTIVTLKNTPELLPGIAVLAFEDFSPDKDQGYFADGISEELLNSLSKISDLQVTSRTSAFSFKGKNVPISEIGKLLAVTHILEGSIRKAGNMLRITAQLINTRNDAHIWSETYDRALTIDNIFDIQDEISTAIVSELKGKLNIIASKKNNHPKSLVAYELYLRARSSMLERQPATLKAAVADFKKVIELDPTFAAAYAGLADAYLLSSEYSDINKVDAIAKAKPMLMRAIELAPSSFDTLIVTATLAYFEADWPKVIRFANEALMINPNSAYALVRLANGYLTNGNPQKALKALEKARVLNPLDIIIVNNLAFLYSRLGQNDAVTQLYESYSSVNPDFELKGSYKGLIAFFEGNYTAAHRYWIKSESPFVADYLVKLYQNVGLRNFGKAAISHKNEARRLIANSDFEKLKILLPKITDSDLQIEISYFVKDFVQAQNLASDKIDAYLDVWAAPGMNSAYKWTLIYAVMKKSNHKSTDIIKVKLSAFFEKMSQTDFSYSEGILSAARFYALNDDEESVSLWLKRFIDLGHATYLLIDPAFNKLRSSKSFITIERGNASNAARHRVAIQAQLDTLGHDLID